MEEAFVPRLPLAPKTLMKEPLMLRHLSPPLPPLTSKLPVVAGLQLHLYGFTLEVLVSSKQS